MVTDAGSMQRGNKWFISGASSGFGRLLAEYLLQQGATVIVRMAQPGPDVPTGTYVEAGGALPW